MTSTKYLLIGGGLASAQAAKELRDRDRGGSISLVGEEPHVPYDRPPLSKEFLRGEKRLDELFFDPEQYFHDQGIGLHLGVKVTDLDVRNKTAVLSDGTRIAFAKALIATGGRPVRLKLPGTDLPGVNYLRTIEHASTISREATSGKRAVIIGAGFIGLEVAASLTQRGVQIAVIEAAPRIWPRFADPALAASFQDYCTQKGVTFLTGESVTEISGHAHASAVLTKSGKELPCDFVCVAIGIAPNVELAQPEGLQIDNGVVVNEYLQSSDPDIYAAGDVANYMDPLFGKRRRVEHWGHAEYCGQLAGQNMAGDRKAYDLLTYVWSDIFDRHLEFAGDESEHDQILLRGRLEAPPFAMFYLKAHEMKAYFAVNASAKDLPVLQKLIKQRKNLSGKEGQLQDPSVPVKSLL